MIQDQDTVSGKPGIILLVIGFASHFIAILDKSEVMFWLGVVSLVTATVYHLILIFKNVKK